MQSGKMLFQNKYPDIIEECLSINEKLNAEYSMNIEEGEVSFDQLIPFLFPTNDKVNSQRLSRELRIYRSIIDNLNNRSIPTWFDNICSEISIPIVSLDSYNEINNSYRAYNSNIFDSYEKSTKRVFYRFLLLQKYKSLFHKEHFNSVYNTIKTTSAFLLFDDDIFDLENDLYADKSTILIQFLEKKSFNLQDAIDIFMDSMHFTNTKSFNVFSCYINQFRKIYHE
jgi:hypothetical protein